MKTQRFIQLALIGIFSFSSSFAAVASKMEAKPLYQIVSIDTDTDSGTRKVTYPQLTKEASRKFKKINSEIQKTVETWICYSGKSSDYEVTSTVDDLNEKYFSFSASGTYYCEGATGGVRQSFVFDLKKGKELNMRLQFQDDLSSLTKMIVTKIPPEIISIEEESCFTGVEEQDFNKLESFGYVMGIKNGELWIKTTPPSAEAACGFEATVPFSAISSLIKNDSVLREWFK